MANDRNPTYFEGDLRRVLLDAALAELTSSGPADLSLRALAREVGVSHAAPAHHFGSKAGLLTMLATEGLDLLAAAMRDRAGDAGDSPDERLAAIGVAYVEFALSRPGYFEVMFRRDLIDVGDDAYVAAGLRTIGVLTDAVQAAIDVGWGRGEDLSVLTMTSWSAVHGIATLSAHGSLEGVAPGRAAEDLADDVTRALAAAFSGQRRD